MKKLLLILGSLTLFASATSTVVACGGDKGTPSIDKPDFDFERLYRQFIGDVETIINSNLETEYQRHAWKSESEISQELGSIDYMIQNQTEIERYNSDLFNKFAYYILSFVPMDRINEQLIKEVVNNVNYRMIIYDTLSPIRKGFQLDTIKLEEKGENSLTINFQITTQVIYKNKLGERGEDIIRFSSSINIFRALTDAQLATRTQDVYFKMFNDTHANKYEFESLSGDLEKNSYTTINRDQNLKQQVKTDVESLIDEIKKFDVDNKITLDTEKLLVRVVDDSPIDASRIDPKTSVVPFSGDETDKLLEKALSAGDDDEGKKYVEEFLDHMKGKTTSWLTNKIPDDEYGNKLKEAQKIDNNISTAINQFNLEANYLDNSNLFKVLSNQNSRFAIDETNDADVLVIYGIKIRGAKFVLNEQTYEFSPINLGLRQRLTPEIENTAQLYDKFIEDAFHFQKAVLNIQKAQNGSNNRDTSIILNSEFEVKTEEQARKFFADGIKDSMSALNPAANEFTKDLSLTNDIYTSSGKAAIEYVVLTANKEMFFHNLITQDEQRDRINAPEFRTYYFYSGIPQKNKLHFTFGPYGTFSNDSNKPTDSLTVEEVKQHVNKTSPIKFIIK